MLCHVTLVRTNVLDESTASIIRVTRICKLGTMLAVTSNQSEEIHPRIQHSSPEVLVKYSVIQSSLSPQSSFVVVNGEDACFLYVLLQQDKHEVFSDPI
jgi:hypothetical protein